MLSGCGTFITQTNDFNEAKCSPNAPASIPRTYSGTILDIWTVAADGPGGQMAAFLFWDIPFSLIGDTVILPYTAVRQMTSGSHRCVPNQ